MEKKYYDKENLDKEGKKPEKILLNFENYNTDKIKQEIEENSKEELREMKINKLQYIKSKRNYGIDLLRIISMYLICLLHVLGKGGILYGTKPQSVNYFIAWFLEISAYCSVDCYALISGYVGVLSKYKLSNFIYLWLQVEFYSLVILYIFAIIKHEMISRNTFLNHLLPVTYGRYWYFTAYLGLFLAKPYLNYSIYNMPKNMAKLNLIIGITIIMILSRLNENFIYLSFGSNSFWLIILYIVGGYIKKYEPFKNIKKRYLILLWIFFIVITWIIKLVREISTKNSRENKGVAKNGNLFVSNLSITIFSVAVIMLELFSRIIFNKKIKIIEILRVSSFGVYLIHLHTSIWLRLHKKFESFASYNPILLILASLGMSLAIYIICSIIDYLRYLLFELIKVRKFLLKLEEKFNKRFIYV